MGLFLESSSRSRSTTSQAAAAEAKRKAEEAKRKAAEAKRKAEEAKRKAEAEAKKKEEAENKKAAKRINEAFKTGGDAAASAKLRKELADASPHNRVKIMHAVKPVLDQIAEDIGLNSRRREEDWGKDGYEKDGSYSTDTKNTNPIDSEVEYQNALQDLAASVQLAGDKDAAFHVASTSLQAMPDGKKSNTEKNLLGLFGDGLAAASADNHPLLLNATAVMLVDSRMKGPKGTELGQSMEKRNAAARMLDPTIDDHLAIKIEDWTDDKGVQHDGHVWHEVSANPDLFLTRKQRESIEKKHEGLSEEKIREIKTDQAKLNIQDQHGDRDLDKVQDGEVLDYENPDKDLGLKLDPEVKKAMDKSKTDHQTDKTYAKHLDRFAGTSGFGKLNKDQQISAVKGYDRTLSQAERSGKPLTIGQENQLKELLTSKQLHKLGEPVKARVEGLFGEFAQSSPSRLDNLQKMVTHSGLDRIGKEHFEMQILEAYQNDSAFSGAVDKLSATKDLSSEDRKIGLDRMRAVKFAGQLYGKCSGDEQTRIMDNVFKTVTSPEFVQFHPTQKKAAIEYLVKYGDQEYGLQTGGDKRAVEKAGKLEVKDDSDVGKKPERTESKKGPDQVTASSPDQPLYGPVVPPTDASVKANLKDTASGAGDFAADDKTINDPLRRDANTDPVDYAYKRLAKEHIKDQAYLTKLNGTIDEFRCDYTTQQVKALVDKNDVDGALKTLQSQMEAAPDAKQRKKIFDAAGKPVFTKEFIRGQLDDALKDTQDGVKKAAKLASAYGENAPAEVANLAVDVYMEEMGKERSPLTNVEPMNGDLQTGKQFYTGLSALVERADQHGAQRAKDMASLLKDKMLPGKVYEKNVRGPRREGPRGDTGMAYGVTDAVKNGNSSLTIALINEYSSDRRAMNAKPNSNMGQEHADWNAHEFRTVLIRELGDGIDAFRGKTKGVVEDWQSANSCALALMNSFGRSDPEKALKLIAADRKEHPSGEEGDDATAIDAKMEEVYKQGVKVYALNQQLQGLDLDLDGRDASESVDSLKSAIEKFTDPKNETVQFSLKPGDVGSDAASLNPELQKYFDGQVNFGTAHAPRPSPLQGVYAERDHLSKWLDANESKLPRAVVQDIRDDTAIWVSKVEDIMTDPPEDAAKQIGAATGDFEKKLAEHLKGQPVQPDNTPNDIKTRILKDREAWQKSGVVWRLSLNCLEATGEGMMAAYARRKAGNVLAGRTPNTSSLAAKTLQNAAHASFADSALVKATADNINNFQNKVAAEVRANKGKPLSKTRIAELKKEFWQTHPNGNKEQPGFKNVDVGKSSHWQKRAANALRIAAFGIGAPVLYGYAGEQQKKEPGYQLSSDQMYAWAFTTGAVTESYKLLTGKGLGPQAKEGVNGAPGKFNGLKWDVVRKVSGLGPGTFLSVADTMWMMEDYQSDHKVNAVGTTILTASDWVDIGAALTPLAARTAATAGLMSTETAAAVSASGWIPVVGWVASAGIVLGQVTRYATSITYEKNKMEYDDNPRYAKMVKGMGFTEEQAREVMNHSGGPVPQFWKGGVSPTVALHRVFDANPGGKPVPEQERLRYLQSLSPGQIKKLVEKCHDIEDHHMSESGAIGKDQLADLKSWMKTNDLWKPAYLGQ